MRGFQDDTPPPMADQNLVSRVMPMLMPVGAMVLGVVTATGVKPVSQALASMVDLTVFALILLLFFGLSIERVSWSKRHLRFLAIAWVANFLLVPTIGFAIASLVISGEPLILTGVIIYFMAPCTDWFLGFTRLAGGNIELGTAFIPINLLTQVALYPVYLAIFTQWRADLDIGIAYGTMVGWLVIPVVIARGIRLAVDRGLPARTAARVRGRASRALPFVIALLILELFASHAELAGAHLRAVGMVLVAAMLFFAGTWIMSEWLARRFDLAYPERALLGMTTAARNAPLMLAITAVAIPDQPLIHAAIVIGMLVEFPHLIVLERLLSRSRVRSPDALPDRAPTTGEALSRIS